MAASWSLQPILLALGFLILIGITTASFWLVHRSSVDARVVAAALETQHKISLVLLHLRRAESTQRGYIITGNPDYLREYQQEARNVMPALAEAKAAIGDNSQEQQALLDMEKLVAVKLAEMERVVQLHDARDRDAAYALIQAGEGRRAMNEAREMGLRLMVQEGNLVAQHTERARVTNLWLLAAMLTGALLIVLIGGLSVYLVQRNAREREKAQRALEDVNANLEHTIAERTADLREANNEIQRFAYIVSHDLRSPLVNIMGFTTELEALRADLFARLESLRSASDDAEKAKNDLLGRDFDEAIGFIKTSIGKMDRLINSILKLSREGRREFRPELVNMHELFQSIADSHAHRAAELGATVEISAVPPAFSDRLALEQIFSNLVDNALKYLQDGRSGRIQLRSHATPTSVIYEVQDNGRGIAPDDHERIFDLFRRAGTQDRPGEGIGLAHVRALVRRLGGQMTLRSALGEGSTFSVSLPRRWSAETAADKRTVA